MKKSKTCFDCIHALIDPGCAASREDPGYAASCECKLASSDDPTLDHWFHEEIEEIHPDFCDHFQARMSGRCSMCGAFIRTPLMDQPSKWFDWNGNPLCSDTCTAKAHEAWDAELRQEREMSEGFDKFLGEG